MLSIWQLLKLFRSRREKGTAFYEFDTLMPTLSKLKEKLPRVLEEPVVIAFLLDYLKSLQSVINRCLCVTPIDGLRAEFNRLLQQVDKFKVELFFLCDILVDQLKLHRFCPIFVAGTQLRFHTKITENSKRISRTYASQFSTPSLICGSFRKPIWKPSKGNDRLYSLSWSLNGTTTSKCNLHMNNH